MKKYDTCADCGISEEEEELYEYEGKMLCMDCIDIREEKVY